MNIKYVMFLFYDIPNSNKKEHYKYTRFRKYILSIGFVMLQESVYVKTIKTKDKYFIVRRDLELSAPEGAEIRSLIVTQSVYDNMDLISCEMNFVEKVISKKIRVLEL